MPDFVPRFAAALQNKTESWLRRVRENAFHLTHGPKLKITSANGAPIHLLNLPPTRLGRAQGVSVLTHAGVIVALAAFALQPRIDRPLVNPSHDSSSQLTPLSPDLLRQILGDKPSAGAGSGGNREPLPATSGHLPVISSIQLVKPSVPHNDTPQLPVPPTLLDSSAPPVLTTITDIGLPWMKDKNNSGGPGKGNTIGSRDGNTMGDGDVGIAGEGGVNGPYRAGVTAPICSYCPDPLYTDEARETKVQGTVTLEVLVGADGRAAQIRIMKGIGAGLEGRTIERVRTWRFTPAYDAAHRPVASWVTIEVLFRLY